MTSIHPSASDANFAELQRDPFFDVVVDLVSDYLGDAFDEPAAGEVDRWTLSALPTTNHTADRHRLCTLNIGPMEALYVERFLEGGDIVDYRVALYGSKSVLLAETGSTLDELTLRYPLLHIRESGMSAADGDAVVVDWFVSDEGSDDQFFALPLGKMIRGLADGLAAKGRGPYAQYHNRAFSEHVLSAETEGHQ